MDRNEKSESRSDKKERPKLDEKDFIHEERGPNPFPVWLVIAAVAAIFFIVWSISNNFFQKMESTIQETPFLQVTNRQFSLFLWQNPEYMRNVRTTKTAYLPGFNSSGPAGPKLDTVEDYVNAPPDVIFRYHSWKKLLGNYVIPRQITPEEFREFLAKEPEWEPSVWAQGGVEYQNFVANLDRLNVLDLQSLREGVLPKDVRIAFLGWKNYYKEGAAINQMRPTAQEVKMFLEKYPNYSPNLWRELEPKYLESLMSPEAFHEQPIPSHELTSFLRAALFNDEMAQKEKTAKSGS